MNLQTILFEDPTVSGFLPLAASVPHFEIRCGMFNLRERVEVVGTAGGCLRMRDYLEGLALDPAWSTGPVDDLAGRCLWLGGRLAPSCELVARLQDAARAGQFVLRDDRGVLAAGVEAGLARDWEESWRAAASGDWSLEAGPWQPPIPQDWTVLGEGEGGAFLAPTAGAPAPEILAAATLDWIWQIVPRTAEALADDLAAARGTSPGRRPWGVVATDTVPSWAQAGTLAPLTDLPPGVYADDPQRVWTGDCATCAPGVVIDTSEGAVVLDRDVQIGPHVLLEGPLYLGPGTRVKAGARIYGESSCGVGCRLAGEIGESTFGDFANKQHEGFVGHAVLGSWINLGAMTTNSDLKNNYGPVRVDLGDGSRDTGLRFVGLLAGDHVKTAIGTLFNTGTVVGFASNIFGAGMPPKHVPTFSWGGSAGAPDYDAERAMATARVVMSRRDCEFVPGHEAVFRRLAAG
ncbi:MAG: hypothetical protein GY838_06825 [bacterium]|nr:hypothetical protein [bacterium]